MLRGKKKLNRNAIIGNTSPGHLLSVLDKNICNKTTPTIKAKIINPLTNYTFPLIFLYSLISTFAVSKSIFSFIASLLIKAIYGSLSKSSFTWIF